jgi:hypothetical protein
LSEVCSERIESPLIYRVCSARVDAFFGLSVSAQAGRPGTSVGTAFFPAFPGLPAWAEMKKLDDSDFLVEWN